MLTVDMGNSSIGSRFLYIRDRKWKRSPFSVLTVAIDLEENHISLNISESTQAKNLMFAVSVEKLSVRRQHSHFTRKHI